MGERGLPEQRKVTRAVSESDTVASPAKRVNHTQPAAGRRRGATRGRKRTRRDSVRPTLDPAALDPPGFVEAPDFIGLEQSTIERVERFVAILRGSPIIPEEQGPPWRRR